MIQINKSFLIWITIVLLVGILDGCTYRERVIASNEVSGIQKLRLILDRETIRYVETEKFVPLDQLFNQAEAIPPPSQTGYRLLFLCILLILSAHG